MDKSTENQNNRPTYPAEIIQALSKKYSVTPTFIRASITESRTSETSTKIRKDYKKVVGVMRTALQEVLNQGS